MNHARSRRREPSGELAQLWAGARAAQQAAALIAERPGADGDLRFITAAARCGEACDELHRVCPGIADFVGTPALAAHVECLPATEAARWLLAAIRSCIFDFDLEAPGLRPVEMLAAGTAATWLGLAHHAICGRLP